jgi:hypothetical protein
MAGKYTRMNYDQGAFDERVARSTDPMLYMLDPNFAVNCNRCFAPFGPINGQQTSDAVGQQIDVDSILRGVTKINSKFNPQQIPDSLDKYKLFHYKNCPDKIEPESTRFTYPPFDIKGLTVPDLNFDYPLHDPQCQIFENFAVNTRLQAKDNHRTIWQVPFGQSDLLPSDRLGKVKNCSINLNCPQNS